MGVRLVCTAVVLFGLSSSAWGQTLLRSASLPDRTPLGPQPIPQILRTASIPDRSALHPFVPVRDVFRAGPLTFVPRPDQLVPFPFPVGFGYVPDVYAPMQVRMRAEPNGYLQLDVRPGTAQVFVDGIYVGEVNDFQQLIPGRALESGPHRVELRAPGYEPFTFDVRIFPNETTTYRTELVRSRTAEKPAVVARAVPKTFYVIPGCYAGDKPPRAADLRRGCDASKLRKIPPQVSSVAQP